MANISRRTALATLAGAASASPLVPLASAALARPDEIGSIITEAGSDPLQRLIRTYRDGLAQFNATEGLTDEASEALADATWRPVFELMEESPPAATSLASALDAIRIVIDEELTDGDGNSFTVNMLRAALAYFDMAGQA